MFEGTPLLRRPFRAAARISDTCIGLEKDGFRAQLARYADCRVLLRSRSRMDMTAAFPKIQDAAPPSCPTTPPCSWTKLCELYGCLRRCPSVDESR